MSDGREAGFAALVVHELRSPLAAMVGAARLLHGRWQELDEPQRSSLLALLADEAGRVERLLGALQDATLVAAGALGYSFAEVDVARVVADAVAAAGLVREGVGVTAAVSGPLPQVQADADRLRQALDNLIGNAIRASASGDTVEVRAESRGGFVRVSVSDRGPGVEAADRERIFAVFERAANRPGTGLGLHVARTVAEAHGGTVELGPTPGGGATFTLVVPAAG